MSRILIVDDEPDMIGLVKRILTSAGYEVDSAPNGKVCLKKLQASNFDLVLLDIMMPEMNGWDVLLRLRKLSITQPRVVFFSVKDDAEYQAKSEHRSKYSSYIGKPFAKQDLLDSVESALSRSSSESKKNKLNSLLKDLTKSKSIVSSIIVSSDGFPIASDITDSVKVQVLAAEVASIMGAADLASLGLHKGSADEVIVKGENVKIVTVGVSEDAFLAVLANHDADSEGLAKKVELVSKKVNKVLKE